jgi:hypothetical protein
MFSPGYFIEYKEFIENMVGKGYVEIVENPEGENYWNIPHFAAFPKIMKKMRLVFHCNVRFKGICLNGLLLQEPDQENSLLGFFLDSHVILR